MENWWKKHIKGKTLAHVNLEVPLLVEMALQMGVGHLAKDGPLVVETGKFTGRAADDKYIVRGSYSSSVIKWGGTLNELKSETYAQLREEYFRYLEELKEVFIMERSAGASPDCSLGVQLITPNPTHALFSRNLFLDKKEQNFLKEFTVFHAPDMVIEPSKYGMRSPTAIIINFEEREVLIIGTSYAGEIKKSIFSILNTLLPDHDILPMHAGANIDEKGVVSVFFGLSGTGKTTLSTDEGHFLVGDDEIGFSSEGIFNMEGGCYAKTYKLKEKDEPQIYHAVNRFGALLENVVLSETTRRPNFEDKSITENGRASYPLSFIPGAVKSGMATTPSHVFFLSADATGVLPPVSRLSPEQSMFYFLSGYTAKLAGTELGLAGVKAAFSHCFGAPFMMRDPHDYANLLKDLMNKVNFKVWLINTGWGAGPYGVGERFPISVTRSIIRAAQSGAIDEMDFWTEPYFDLSIPKQVPGVDPKYLNPCELWQDKAAYAHEARNLRAQFVQNYEKIKSKDALGAALTLGEKNQVIDLTR